MAERTCNVQGEQPNCNHLQREDQLLGKWVIFHHPTPSQELSTRSQREGRGEILSLNPPQLLASFMPWEKNKPNPTLFRKKMFSGSNPAIKTVQCNSQSGFPSVIATAREKGLLQRAGHQPFLISCVQFLSTVLTCAQSLSGENSGPGCSHRQSLSGLYRFFPLPSKTKEPQPSILEFRLFHRCLDAEVLHCVTGLIPAEELWKSGAICFVRAVSSTKVNSSLEEMFQESCKLWWLQTSHDLPWLCLPAGQKSNHPSEMNIPLGREGGCVCVSP